jgi:hypothetical protein
MKSQRIYPSSAGVRGTDRRRRRRGERVRVGRPTGVRSLGPGLVSLSRSAIFLDQGPTASAGAADLSHDNEMLPLPFVSHLVGAKYLLLPSQKGKKNQKKSGYYFYGSRPPRIVRCNLLSSGTDG